MRLIRQVMIAVTLVISAVFFVPATAQAGPGWFDFCVPTTSPLRPICMKVYVEQMGPRPWWPPECKCDPTMDLTKEWIDPAIRYEFGDYLGQGMAVLAEATFTKDEKLAEQLRVEAGELFLNAAMVVAQYDIALQSVGWVDQETGEYYESQLPDAWITTGRAIAEGVNVLQDSLGKDPDIEGAMKHFDEAYAGIAELAAS